MIRAVEDPGAEARRKLIQWLADLLDHPIPSWNRAHLAFLDSLLRGQEGTKTLAELAVTSVRIKASRLKPEELGRLNTITSAIEDFWNNPCAETYEALGNAGRTLDSDA